MSIGLSALRSASPNFEAHLRRLCDKGQITSALDELTRAQETLSSPTYCYLLHTCLDAESYTLTKLLHSHLLAQATHLTPFVGNLWVTTFAKSGAIKEALQASISLPKIDVSSWTAIISAYAGYGCEREAFSVFQRMCDCGLEPSKFTLISLFKACGSLEDLSLGRMLHAYAQEKGIVLDVFASNTLLRMYGKCGAMLEAEAVFYHIASRTQTSWNAMLSTYVDLGYGELALKLYRQLQQEGENPNELTFLCAIQACNTLTDKDLDSFKGLRSTSAPLEIARALHGDAYRMGYTSDNLIASALVHIYGKFGSILEAQNVFNRVSDANVVSWTSMISACVDQGDGIKALHLYKQMCSEGVSPNERTYKTILQAMGILMEKDNGISLAVHQHIVQALHKDLDTKGYLSDSLIGSAFISLYGKCQTYVQAEKVYQRLSIHDSYSANAMLLTYIEHGEFEKSSQFIRKILAGCVIVDEVSLMCMLRMSREIGSSEATNKLHFDIVSAGCSSVSSISATLIHAYGGCGSSADAEMVLEESFYPDEALMNACLASHTDDCDSLGTFRILHESEAAGLKADKISLTIILSACCHIGLIIDGLGYYDSMCHQGVQPDLQHYCNIVSMLGRAGNFGGVEDLLGNISDGTDAIIWLSLLGACQIHGHTELGDLAFQNAVNILPEEAASYVLMRNTHNCRWGHKSFG